MDRFIKSLIWLGLGTLGSWMVCSLISSNANPLEWESGVKAFGTFLILGVMFGSFHSEEE